MYHDPTRFVIPANLFSLALYRKDLPLRLGAPPTTAPNRHPAQFKLRFWYSAFDVTKAELWSRFARFGGFLSPLRDSSACPFVHLVAPAQLVRPLVPFVHRRLFALGGRAPYPLQLRRQIPHPRPDPRLHPMARRRVRP